MPSKHNYRKRRQTFLARIRKAKRNQVPVRVRRGNEIVIEYIDPRPRRMRANNLVVRTALNRSGEQFRRPMLHIQDKRVREEIISYHYRSTLKHHGIDVPETLTARDSPHDFTYEASDGSQMLLEVTSVSDHSSNWVLAEAEQQLMSAMREAGVVNSSVAILPHGMSTRAIRALVRDITTRPVVREIDHQWLMERMAEASATKQPALFLLDDNQGRRHNFLFNVRRPVVDIVREAIDAKVAKGYAGMPEMVLIVDEQSTQHSQADFRNAWDELIGACQNDPFREVYLYSGHYSNEDGRGAEFDLYPLKACWDPHVEAVIRHGPCRAGHDF